MIQQASPVIGLTSTQLLGFCAYWQSNQQPSDISGPAIWHHRFKVASFIEQTSLVERCKSRWAFTWAWQPQSGYHHILCKTTDVLYLVRSNSLHTLMTLPKILTCRTQPSTCLTPLASRQKAPGKARALWSGLRAPSKAEVSSSTFPH